LTGRWRSDRGQSTAMVVVMLWVMILFVALVANVGQAVNRRIALQVVADSGAYSGASKMAEGMNHIAYANGVIQDFYGLATWAWAVNTAALSTCAGFDGINNAYKGGFYAMDIPIQAINFGYGGWAKPGGQITEEARRNAEFNAWDLFPGEKLEYDQWDPSPEMGVILPSRDAFWMVDLEEVPSYSNTPDTKYDAIPPLGTTGHQNHFQPCLTVCGLVPCVIPKTWDFPLWYEKSDKSSKYVTWIATAPATRSMMFDGFFGGVPKMKAVAVARAVGGDIDTGDYRYVAEMMPVKSVQTMGGYITDTIAPGMLKVRKVTH
jgi:hypothetical protein